MSYDTLLGVNNNIYIDQYPQQPSQISQQQQSQLQNSFDFENADDFLYSISGVMPYDNPNYINNNLIQSPVSNSGDDELLIQSQQSLPYETSNNDDLNFNFNIDTEINPIDSTNRSHSISTLAYSNGEVTPNSNISHDSSNLTSPEPTTTSITQKAPSKKVNKITKPLKKDKNSHNMIEKKYRTNINSKILALRDAVPSLRIAAGCNDLTIADLEGLTPASKLNKASVLTKATEYIKHLEAKNDSLKSQNLQLQRLIQQANLNPRPELYYNQQTSPPSSSPSSSPQQSQPNKLLLGGMAAVMGTSLFGGSGENDFRSLSALPFSSFIFPNALLNPTQLTIQLWNLTKLLLVLGSLASLIIPMVNNYKTNEKKKSDFNLFHWFLIVINFKLPNKLSEEKKNSILSNLIHGDSTQLIYDFFYLLGCEINFENNLLTLIICCLIKQRYPIFQPILNHFIIIKCSLIQNLDYKGSNKSLIKLNQLIGKVDGCAMFGSENLIKRLSNLFMNKPFNYKIEKNTQDSLKYVEFYKLNESNYYEIVLNWRLLEIIHDLNIAYLENLNENDDNQILADLKILTVLNGESKIGEYYKLFDSIVNPNQSIYLLQSLKQRVASKLEKFNLIKDGPELTDGEITDDEEEEGEEKQIQQKIIPSFKSQKSLISSLNLISQDEFITLSSSLTIYYYKNDQYEKAVKSLNYLSKLESLTLFSFTSIVNLLNEIIPGKIQDNEVLDKLITLSRKWLHENNQVLTQDLNDKLAKLIVNKNMILNGVNDTDNED